MYLLKREKGKAIKGIKSYGLIHHAVATWQLILAKSFSYCWTNIFLRYPKTIRFSTETMSKPATVQCIINSRNEKIFSSNESRLPKSSCNCSCKSYCPLNVFLPSCPTNGNLCILKIATELSNFILDQKSKNIDVSLEWSILGKAKPDSSGLNILNKRNALGFLFEALDIYATSLSF